MGNPPNRKCIKENNTKKIWSGDDLPEKKKKKQMGPVETFFSGKEVVNTLEKKISDGSSKRKGKDGTHSGNKRWDGQSTPFLSKGDYHKKSHRFSHV